MDLSSAPKVDQVPARSARGSALLGRAYICNVRVYVRSMLASLHRAVRGELFFFSSSSSKHFSRQGLRAAILVIGVGLGVGRYLGAGVCLSRPGCRIWVCLLACENQSF